MSKKVIGALLAIALVLSVFSFSVFAVGTGYESEADASKYTQIWGLANKQGSDGTYTVDVVLTTDYLVGPVQFQINGVDEVTKVTVGGDYYPAVANAGKSGLVSLIPDTSTTLEGKKLTNAVIATVTYKSASNGTPSMDATDYKSASKPQGSLMAARLEGSTAVNFATFIVGQKPTVVPLGGEMPEPPAGDAKLQVKAGVTGVVIDETKTFGGKYAGAVYGFNNANGIYMTNAHITSSLEASDGSALTITGAGATGKAYGTGATVKVGDKTYVVVIFGDANGDGMVNGQDVTVVVTGEKKLAQNSPARMAANCHNMANGTLLHMINGQDVTPLVTYNAKKSPTFQSDLAKIHFGTTTTFYK